MDTVTLVRDLLSPVDDDKIMSYMYTNEDLKIGDLFHLPPVFIDNKLPLLVKVIDNLNDGGYLIESMVPKNFIAKTIPSGTIILKANKPI